MFEEKISHFYLFYGENDFQKNMAIEKLKEKLLGKEISDFNFRIFYGDELSNDISPVIGFITSFPFVTEKKLAIVRKTDHISEEALNNILPYLKDPPEFAYIVFTAQKPDFRIEFFKYIKDSKNAIQFRQFSEAETISWIKKMGKEIGIDISDEASSYLYYMVGNNLDELYSELQKLLSYYGEGAKIGIGEIKFIVSFLRDYSIFDLVDSISSKKLSDSLRILNRYLEREGKEKALPVLSMIIRQLSLIQKTKLILKMGGGIGKVQKLVQPYVFLAKKLIEQSHFWTEDEIERAFSIFLEADSLIKTGAPPSIVLEKAIISLCS